MKWKIETFHKIMKSGCKAEDAKLRTAERLANLIAILCLLSWRIFWLTMLTRTRPEASPYMALTPTEIYLLDQQVNDPPGARPPAISSPYTSLNLPASEATSLMPKTRLQENAVAWRGLTRLTDIELDFILGTKLLGN